MDNASNILAKEWILVFIHFIRFFWNEIKKLKKNSSVEYFWIIMKYKKFSIKDENSAWESSQISNIIK